MRNFRKNISGVAQKNSAKPRKTHCVSCAKVRKQKICAKIAQILRKRFSYFVETLDGLCVIFFKQPRTYLLLLKISWKIDVLISNRVSQLVIFFHNFLHYAWSLFYNYRLDSHSFILAQHALGKNSPTRIGFRKTSPKPCIFLIVMVF